eukprot:1183679-Prorocentrum_minimum.AAC.6
MRAPPGLTATLSGGCRIDDGGAADARPFLWLGRTLDCPLPSGRRGATESLLLFIQYHVQVVPCALRPNRIGRSVLSWSRTHTRIVYIARLPCRVVHGHAGSKRWHKRAAAAAAEGPPQTRAFQDHRPALGWLNGVLPLGTICQPNRSTSHKQWPEMASVQGFDGEGED